eukprot:TRINITY_DN17295_c0_g1_i1.p1 TRINITY_DN17295_c0_g1~~TRINITY_DN17295_c0_g1_i1.p1  ORF type:complete len:155 (+),score=9.86 TRINITY_DN17295_c0_g1_i1:42-506(+)
MAEYPHLCAIELQGFKSFRDFERVTVNPDGVTYVVGDNGSGKSNVIDGICFVMQMKNHLIRCKTCDDVVNWEKTECEVTLEFTDRTTLSRTHRLGKGSTYRHNKSLVSASACSEILKNTYGINPSFPESFVILQNFTQSLVSSSCCELMRYVLV